MNPDKVQQLLPPTEENYKKASTSVWWDMGGCQIPEDNDPNRITLLVGNIKSALEQLNYKGDVTIHAYGHFDLFNLMDLQALAENEIILIYVPSGGKNTIGRRLMVDMLDWTGKNPSPSNIMLLSEDEYLSDVLSQLRRRKYNILLATPMISKSSLVVAANTVWQWKKLSCGELPDVLNSISCLPDVEGGRTSTR